MSSSSTVVSVGNGFITNFEHMPLGRPFGGKRGMVTVKCPKCSCPAWKKSDREYVHQTLTKLVRNEPTIEVTRQCLLSKPEAERIALGKPLVLKP
jgi:hypothetical protein